MVLAGREVETGELEALVRGAESGTSGVRVLVGPAGIGKTALLDHAVSVANGFHLTRVAAVEVEHDLGFAALHCLLRPFLGLRGRLPEPQRTALEAAFGMLEVSAPPDLFLIGLATLTLLAEAAADRPMLVVCDDGQWMDPESVRVLGFVARRVDAEGIVLLFGIRDDGGTEAALRGLPTLWLDGLADHAATELLNSALHVPVDGVIAAQTLAVAAGNPLAILEAVRGLRQGTAAGTAVGEPILPLDHRLEAGFLTEVHRLDPLTRDLLLVLAADPGVDDLVARRATEDLTGAETAAVERAARQLQTTDLLVAGSNPAVHPVVPRFRHPLIRSAVYGGAAAERRRRTHAALAATVDPVRDADRRAWHLAAAADGTDERVASELEKAATRARDRGGFLAQATFLSRAAELSPPGADRDGRLLGAIGAALSAGAPHLAGRLLDLLPPSPTPSAFAANVLRLRGFANVMLGRDGTVPLLYEAAQILADLDPRSARDTLLEAFDAVTVVARIGDGMSARRIATAALHAPACPGEPSPADLLLDAHAELVGREYVSAVPAMRRGLDAMLTARPDGDASRWLLLGLLLAIELWDVDALGDCSQRYAAVARDQGAMRVVQVATHGLATHALMCGQLLTAAAYFGSFKDTAAAIGADMRFADASDVLLHAWFGDSAQTLAKAAVQDGPNAEVPGGLQVQMARAATVVLYLGRCDYGAAQEAAIRVFDEDPPHFGSLILADLVEAAVRNHDPATAARALDRLHARASASGTPWALGILARSQGLLDVTDDADKHYQQALTILASTPLESEVARTRLVYGEWLRRRRRIRDAREQLRAAHDLFTGMGAAAFAARAGAELSGTGEQPRQRNSGPTRSLTSRELQVARLAAEGLTNQRIAAELFLSVATVEYHLRKIFRKLDITSRRDLRKCLASSNHRATST